MLRRTFLTVSLSTLAISGMRVDSAKADAVISVTLWDKGGMIDMAQNMMMGMGMKHHMEGHMKQMAMMGIDVDVDSVPAGKVTFKVKNTSKQMQHEMLISPIKDEKTQLPFIENENRVDEEASGDLGEVSELDPGKEGALTLDLKPGLYILYCNVTGHYTWGMWKTIKVA